MISHLLCKFSTTCVRCAGPVTKMGTVECSIDEAGVVRVREGTESCGGEAVCTPCLAREDQERMLKLTERRNRRNWKPKLIRDGDPSGGDAA